MLHMGARQSRTLAASMLATASALRPAVAMPWSRSLVTMSSQPERPLNLYALDEAGLSAKLEEWGQPKFRAKQLRKWLYETPVGAFDDPRVGPAPRAPFSG